MNSPEDFYHTGTTTNVVNMSNKQKKIDLKHVCSTDINKRAKNKMNTNKQVPSPEYSPNRPYAAVVTDKVHYVNP